MKYFFITVVFLAFQGFAFESKGPKDRAVNKKSEDVNVQSPQLKTDEYSLFLDDKYRVFKTQKSDNLEFDLSCFKKNPKKPDCMAFTYAKMKAENVETPHPAMNNMAAFHCTKMKGKNLIAIDAKHNEKDFCRFADNSMVSSWSMYLKHNPVPVVK